MLSWSGSYIIQKEKDWRKAHQIKLESIVKALKWLETDMDLDEVTFSLYYFYNYLIYEAVATISSFVEKEEINTYGAIITGRMRNVHSDIQKSCQRILCPQEQGSGSKQARSFSQIEWQASEFIECCKTSQVSFDPCFSLHD